MCCTYEVITKQRMGFLINLTKSALTPSRELEFLGFRLNSMEMTVSLPRTKTHSLTKLAKSIRSQQSVSLRDLSKVLGTMVATHPAVLPAPLYFWNLERARSIALRQGLSYNATVEVTGGMRLDLSWWITSLSQHNGRALEITQWNLTIESDASKIGWGASCQNVPAGRPWTSEERVHSINYLELFAAILALQTFASSLSKVAILLLLDNATAIAYLNRISGSHSDTLSHLAVKVWRWCLVRNIVIHAEHIPGRENDQADWESRHTSDSSDWMLD